MNEDIYGIIAVLIFASPFIALPIIIGFKIYRKFRPAKQKAQIQQQPEGQPTPSQPASRLRRIADFIVVIFMVVLAGPLVGVVAALFSYLIYIVLVFPLMMGFAGGNMVTGAVQMGKIRKTSQLIVLSLLAAITIYGTYHYGRYVGLQVQTSLEMFSGLSEATEDKNLRAAKAFVDYALKEETGYPGFAGYMLYKSNQGVSIGRFYSSNRLNLGPVLTWLYWVLEFGVILWITIRMGKKQVDMPFCESCGNWYGSEKHLGGTSHAHESLVLDLVKRKDYIELKKLIQRNAELPSLELYFQGCEKCNKSHSQLVVRYAFQSAKGGLQFTDASQTVLQPQESILLLSQLQSAGD